MTDRVYEKAKNTAASFRQIEWSDHRQFGARVQQAEALFGAIRDALIERFDYAVVADREETLEPGEPQVREGVVHKMTTAEMDTAVNGLGLVLAVLSHSAFPVLFCAWTGLTAYQLLRTIYSRWEALRDNHERAVFESVLAIQAELSAASFEWLKDRDFDCAFERVAAPTGSVVARLKEATRGSGAITALARLKHHEAFLCSGDRWCVAV